MLIIDQLPLYPVGSLPKLFLLDSESKFLALKVKPEGQYIVLHAIYIEKQLQSDTGAYCALVTVTEWQGKSEREEFFLEAENAEQLLEKLQRFDEINNFIFMKIPNALKMEVVTMQPQEMLCLLFPELGDYHQSNSKEGFLALKQESLALLERLEKQYQIR